MTWHGRCGTIVVKFQYESPPPKKKPGYARAGYRSISNRWQLHVHISGWQAKGIHSSAPAECALTSSPFFSFSGLLTFSKHATVTAAQRGGGKKSLPPSPWEWRDHVQHFWVDYALKDESSISVAPQSLLILFNYRSLFPKWGHCSCTVRHPFTTLGVFMIYNNLPAVGRLGVGGSTCVTTTRSVSA